MHQNEYSGRAIVVHATMDKGKEISTELLNLCNENELGIKFVSIKCTSSTVIINVIRINYCNKEDLRFEVLKGISVKDIVEY